MRNYRAPRRCRSRLLTADQRRDLWQFNPVSRFAKPSSLLYPGGAGELSACQRDLLARAKLARSGQHRTIGKSGPTNAFDHFLPRSLSQNSLRLFAPKNADLLEKT